MQREKLFNITDILVCSQLTLKPKVVGSSPVLTCVMFWKCNFLELKEKEKRGKANKSLDFSVWKGTDFKLQSCWFDSPTSRSCFWGVRKINCPFHF